MAIEIKFYTFNKNPNSTKQPTGGGGTSFLCNLIDPTSLTAPDIALTVNAKPTVYNYAYIAEFDRYYFVNDWTYSSGRWIASLNVDTLASFKNYIGESRQYVLRSAARYDGDIIDTLYPSKNNVSTAVQVSSDIGGANPFISNLSEGCFVVGIVNSDSAAIGCVSYYVFTSGQFRAFCNALMGSPEWMYEGIEEIGVELTKILFNPFQYVASCMWLPVTSIGVSGATSAIPYGWWSLPVSAARLSGNSRLASAVFSIPKHPQNERGAYLNKSPFSKYTLFWPCFGQFPLDADILGSANTLHAQCFIDPISGRGTLNVSTSNATLLTTQTQVGVPIQLAQMASDYLGAAGSITSAVSNAFKLDIGGMFQSIGDAVSNAMPQLSTMGSNGGTGAYLFPPTLDAVFYPLVDDDNEHRGRPLMQDAILSSLPGYNICADAELEAPCTSQELDTIKNYLNGGFYYE